VDSQNYFETYENLSQNFNQNNYSINKTSVDSLITLSRNDEKPFETYKIAHNFSLISYKTKNLKDAINYAQIAISIKKEHNEYDSDYVDSLYRLGFFSSRNSNYELAFSSYNEIINLEINPIKIGLSYCDIGHNFFLQNDYYESISYFKKGINKLESINAYKNLLHVYENLSEVYNELSDKASLDSKLEILKKASDLENKINISLEDRLRINNSYSNLYSNKLTYNFKKAKYYLRENLKISLENNYDTFLQSTYNNLANIYNLEKKDSALYYANKAISKSINNKSLALSYFQKSDYYKNKGNYIEGLKNIQKSIDIKIDKEYDYKTPLQLKVLNETNDKDQLLLYLVQKNKLLYLQNAKKNDKPYLELALQHVLVADSLIDKIQDEITNATKLHWRLKASELFSQGIEICYNLNKPEIAFYLSEKGKALLLTESILKNKALSQLPDSIKNKELALRKVITQNKLKKNNDLLFESQLTYDAYMNSVKTEFPNYFKNKSFQKIISLNEVKDKLDKKTVIVSYIWPNSDNDIKTVYGLFTSKEKIELLKIGDSESVTKLIKNYRKLISKPFTKSKDKIAFNKIAYQLYNLLLQPTFSNLNNYEDLVIIPDAILHNIPFEALITDKNSVDYLIKSKTISYAYSLSFTEQNSRLSRNSKSDFIGFAPVTFDKLKLNTLKNSAKELNFASSLIKGYSFIESTATKSSFLANATDAKIIHLATHAEASESPWIAFHDEKLTLDELYNFKNSAELTILSSCNTSIGEIATGEGVMSLARGFFYSGSNAVMASLWNVNDKSTSFLMEDFYKNLKKGTSKSEALRNAKLNYLESHSLAEASPYYWSSFVLLGDTGKVDLGCSLTTVHYLIIGFVILLLAILFLSKRTKQLEFIKSNNIKKSL
jgi:CHAT domain-containing protein